MDTEHLTPKTDNIETAVVSSFVIATGSTLIYDNFECNILLTFVFIFFVLEHFLCQLIDLQSAYLQAVIKASAMATRFPVLRQPGELVSNCGHR